MSLWHTTHSKVAFASNHSTFLLAITFLSYPSLLTQIIARRYPLCAMRYAGSYLELANFFMDDPLPLYSLTLTITAPSPTPCVTVLILSELNE